MWKIKNDLQMDFMILHNIGSSMKNPSVKGGFSKNQYRGGIA